MKTKQTNSQSEKKINTEQTNFRIEKTAKRAAYKVLDELHIKPTALINMLFQEIALRKGIPLLLEMPNEETLSAFNEIKKGKGNRAKNSQAFFEEMGI